MQAYLLSILIFLPLLASVGILILPNSKKHLFQTITITTIFILLVITCFIFFSFDCSSSNSSVIDNFQFVEKQSWIYLDLGNLGKLSIDYFIGVDGLNVSMVLLSAIVLLVGAIVSKNFKGKEKGYFSLYLLLTSSVFGCFIALDFFLFYLFFEFMLLPMYFLIGIWGGKRRQYASIKFFLYTLAGSLFILVVMIALFLSVIDPEKTAVLQGLIKDINDFNPDILSQIQELLAQNKIDSNHQVHSFNILLAQDHHNYISNAWLTPNNLSKLVGFSPREMCFLFMLIGFGIKLPVIPVHTWLPDAHVEAPTAISVVLAGILLKIGGYGLLRIAYGIFYDVSSSFNTLVAILGVVSIIYGAMNAIAMRDFKKMIAYSSVSHMGFVLIGIASLSPEGWNGAVFQLFSHGILSTLLFILVGILYDKTGNRNIESYGGLIYKMPYYGTFIIIVFFASLGLPGFSGFIGEFFTILGSFSAHHLSIWIGILSTLGIILGASYFLWTLQRMFFGKFYIEQKEWEEKLTIISLKEKLLLFSLSFISIILGIFPNILFNTSQNTVGLLLSIFN